MKSTLMLIVCLFLIKTNCYSQQTTNELENINKERIISISFFSGGGKWSGTTKLKITADSVIFYSVKHKLKSKDWETRSIKEKTIYKTWIAITNNVDLNIFKNLKDGENRNQLDLPDTGITVQTSEKTYSHIIDESNYESIKALMVTLENEIKRFG